MIRRYHTLIVLHNVVAKIIAFYCCYTILHELWDYRYVWYGHVNFGYIIFWRGKANMSNVWIHPNDVYSAHSCVAIKLYNSKVPILDMDFQPDASLGVCSLWLAVPLLNWMIRCFTTLCHFACCFGKLNRSRVVSDSESSFARFL